MFVAILLVCVMGSHGENCFIRMDDIHGPSPTIEACQGRLMEMNAEVGALVRLPMPWHTKGACKPVQPQQSEPGKGA